MFPYGVFVITPLVSRFLITLLTFAFENCVACCICFCQTSPFVFRNSTIFCSLSISVGTMICFFFCFCVLIFGFCSMNHIAVPAASSIASPVVIIHAIGGPITFLVIADIGSSCPFCCQYSIILCPSEYTSFGVGVM